MCSGHQILGAEALLGWKHSGQTTGCCNFAVETMGKDEQVVASIETAYKVELGMEYRAVPRNALQGL